MTNLSCFKILAIILMTVETFTLSVILLPYKSLLGIVLAEFLC